MSLLKLFAIGNLLFLWAADTATAAELPAAVIPAGVGVNIHFTKGHERDLDLIAEAGFKFVRIDFTWAGISGTPHKIQLAIPGGSEKHIPVIDGRGNPATAQVADGHVQLELTAQPQYVKLLQPMQAQ